MWGGGGCVRVCVCQAGCAPLRAHALTAPPPSPRAPRHADYDSCCCDNPYKCLFNTRSYAANAKGQWEMQIGYPQVR